MRHRRYQPRERVDAHAAACAARALAGLAKATVFLATDQPSRLGGLRKRIRAAAPDTAIDFRSLNVSSVPEAERERLRKLARTDVRRPSGIIRRPLGPSDDPARARPPAAVFRPHDGTATRRRSRGVSVDPALGTRRRVRPAPVRATRRRARLTPSTVTGTGRARP